MNRAERVVHVHTSDVRVTEWRLASGASTGVQRHTCDFVMVSLTTGLMHLKQGDSECTQEFFRVHRFCASVRSSETS